MTTAGYFDTALGDIAAARLGYLIFAGDPAWDDARRCFNLTVDQHPACIGLPRSAADVADLVRAARTAGLRVAPQLGGHNAGPLGSLRHTMLLRTEGLNELRIDPAARTARVGAGVRWGAVSDAAAAHGLIARAGSSRDVGVVGYTLGGGGLSWIGRAHGLAVNAVTAVELVLADGRVVRADDEHEPELFWAVRGGGANLGVVTSIEFGLLGIPRVFAGVLFFPMERARKVLRTWRAMIDGAPDELTTVGRLLRMPDIPGVPPPLAGRDFAVVEVIHLGGAEAARTFLRPLTDLGPEIDTTDTIDAVRLGWLHMDPDQPVPSLSDHMLLSDVTPEALDALVAAAGSDSGSVLLSVELRHLGGAFARRPRGAGALGALDARFATFALGMPVPPAEESLLRADLAAVRSALEVHEGGRNPNFTEERVPMGSMFDAATLARLEAARRTFDPGGVFQANHEIEV